MLYRDKSNYKLINLQNIVPNLYPKTINKWVPSVIEVAKAIHPSSHITEFEIEIAANGTFYEVEMATENGEVELYFDGKGKRMKNTSKHNLIWWFFFFYSYKNHNSLIINDLFILWLFDRTKNGTHYEIIFLYFFLHFYHPISLFNGWY